jgi:hypothetical protein
LIAPLAGSRVPLRHVAERVKEFQRRTNSMTTGWSVRTDIPDDLPAAPAVSAPRARVPEEAAAS